MHTEQLDLETVKATVDEWRATRGKQGKIPEHIWTDILSLIGRYDIATINRTLGITHQQIKAKMDSLVNAELNQIKEAQFARAVVNNNESVPAITNNVVPIQSKQQSTSHDIEITRKDGAVLKVKGVQHSDTQSIITSFYHNA